MKNNELLLEHFMKIMGMPKKFISENSNACLSAAIDEINKAKQINEFNEEFQKNILNSLALIFYTLVELNENQIDNTHSSFSRYRTICDGFMLTFSELHNKYLEMKKQNEQEEVLQENKK